MWPKLKSWIEHHEPLLYMLILLVILRLPSLFEPYWYGDEGIYLTIGQALRHGVELYKDIHDNKPPLLYLVAALSNGTLFWFKFSALIANFVTLIVFSRLVVHWFGKGKAANLSLIVFTLLTALPYFEGNIANAEIFFITFTVLSFYLLLAKKSKYYLVLAGLFLGLGGLFKIPALLEAAVFPVYWFLIQEKAWFKKSLIFGVSALVPLGLSIGYFATRGTLNSYLIAAGLQNVPYLVSWHAEVFLLGTLKARAAALILLLVIVWIVRKRLDKQIVLLTLWFLVTLFAVLLSGRPYPHYLLQITPVLSLITGYVFLKKQQLVPIALILLFAGCYQAFGFKNYSVLPYYSNFGSWVIGQKTKGQYFDWFNGNMTRDYTIAETIMEGSLSTDKIFVWGDEPVIYALSKRLPLGKYTVKYHILDFGAQEQTFQLLKYQPPRYIVTFGSDVTLPGLPTILRGYILEKEIANAQIYRHLR